MPGADDDDDPRRPPPHPLDRTWIHPSELGAARAAAGPQARTTARGRSWRREAALAVTAGAIGALATVLVLAAVGAFDTEPQRAASTTSIPLSTDAATIATRVGPAVAAITATAGVAQTRGSGIVIGTHEILTTSDVVGSVDGTGTVEVSVASGHQHSATVKAADPVTRLVVLDVPGLRMQPVDLGTPEGVRAGDWVVAVGRTATTGPWVTSGVVTATRGWTQDANGVGHPGLITTNTAVVDEARGARSWTVGAMSSGSSR